MLRLTVSQKVLQAVTPAKAGVQNSLVFLDSGFRRNDRKGCLLTSYEVIKIGEPYLLEVGPLQRASFKKGLPAHLRPFGYSPDLHLIGPLRRSKLLFVEI